jgi:hypothetical protein
MEKAGEGSQAGIDTDLGIWEYTARASATWLEFPRVSRAFQ